MRLKSNPLLEDLESVTHNTCNELSALDHIENIDLIEEKKRFFDTNFDNEKSAIWLQEDKKEFMNNKQEESFSFSIDIEKNLDFLNEIYEDDLNEAKLSLDEISEIDNDLNLKYFFNLANHLLILL